MGTKLIALVGFAKNENWEEMDSLIPEVCNQPGVIEWSLKEGIKDEDGNVRDLAVSLLEKSKYKLKKEDVMLLSNLMQKDKNIYVQFRAAFTLYSNGIQTKDVLDKMHEALKDNDVKEIAVGYLGTSL